MHTPARLGVLAILALAVSCGGHAAPAAKDPANEALPQLPPPAKPDAYSPALVIEGVTPGPGASFPDGADPALTPIDQPIHARARDAARAGRLHEAKRLLGHLAFSYPEHEVLLAQYNAVAGRIDAAQAAAKADLEAASLRTPPPAPAVYTLVRRAPVSDPAIPKLVKRSQTKNKITDDEAWFQKNDLRTPKYFVERPGEMLWAPGFLSTKIAIDLKSRFVYIEHELSHEFSADTLPLEIPPEYGSLPLLQAVDSKPYVVATYGGRVIAVFDAAKKLVGLFDLASYAHPPANKQGKAVVGSATLTTSEGTQHADLTVETSTITLRLEYALAADGVLYVEHLFNGYTKEAKGQTGYITALDIATGEMLWRSPPLVANGRDFLLVHGGLVCGYGFTAEPRFVYVLDRATGAKKQTIQTSTTPNVFIPKGDAIYVRGYDSDFVFDVKPGGNGAVR